MKIKTLARPEGRERVSRGATLLRLDLVTGCFLDKKNRWSDNG